ncbi:hypothetical protein NDU88_001562 [Pleurodeles waltl]|uniref:Uncharacterized protein n=1 Tax=Pleurodeles waltl TaxID=8319 RepID=A0AAV7L108_PLEWA|nr:hypothetical protein NDU88_001562 [Pleurodeles waltl]
MSASSPGPSLVPLRCCFRVTRCPDWAHEYYCRPEPCECGGSDPFPSTVEGARLPVTRSRVGCFNYRRFPMAWPTPPLRGLRLACRAVRLPAATATSESSSASLRDCIV